MPNSDRDFFQTTHLEEVPIRDEEANVIKEGQLRLVNGRTDREVSQIDFAVARSSSLNPPKALK